MDFFAQGHNVGFRLPDFSHEAPVFFPGTSCRILDGQKVQQHFVAQAKQLLARKKISPTLAVILVGNNPASKLYVEKKQKIFAEANFQTQIYSFAEQDTEKLSSLIEDLNKNPQVHGILVQLPLPKHINSKEILEKISPQKDIDGFLKENIGALALGYPSFLPCTPFGILCLLNAYGISVAQKNIVIVGRSSIVGKPLGLLLLNLDATVTFTHSKTLNLKEITQSADILISATGCSEMITADYIQPGAIVIDVGISRSQETGKICGDTKQSEIKKKASALTPVPGGVGPMTIAMLLINTAIAAWSKPS